MGLFDKIKDNAKNISMRALYEEIPDENTPADDPNADPAHPTADGLAIPEGLQNAANDSSELSTPESASASTGSTAITVEPPKAEKDANSDKVTVKKTASRPVRRPPAKKPQTVPAPVMQMLKPKVIDVAPNRGVLDPSRKAIYARERAALVALAARRRMDGTVPLYTANHLTFKTRVFIDRIEYSGSFGRNVLPIEQVSWIKLRAGGTGVILETSEGKRVVMVIRPKDRLAFAEAVMKVQDMQPKREKFKDTKTVRIDQLDKFGEGVDEIEKLSKLHDKGIITQEEFDTKKKQILGI